MAENMEPASFGLAGPAGLEEKVSPSWLVLERLKDLQRDQGQLREDMNKRFDDVNKRFDDVNRRFDDVNKRFDDVSMRFDDVSMRFDDVNRRIGDFRSVNWVILLAVLGILAKLFFPAL